MERHTLDQLAAAEKLRGLAERTDRTLAETAQGTIDGSLRLDNL